MVYTTVSDKCSNNLLSDCNSLFLRVNCQFSRSTVKGKRCTLRFHILMVFLKDRSMYEQLSPRRTYLLRVALLHGRPQV